MRRRPLLIPLTMAAGLLLAGCGSTVAERPGAAAAGVGVDSGAAAGFGPTADGGLQRTASGVTPGAALAAPGERATGTGPVAVQGSTRSEGSTSFGRAPRPVGVSATSVAIGFVYSANSAAAAEAVSGGHADFGDPLAFAKAMVKRVNATGGLGGRRIVLEPYSVDSFDSRPQSEQQQAICEYYTQDHKVFAVMNAGGDIVRACFAKRGVVPVASSFATLGETELAADEGYLDVSSFTPEASLANLVDSFDRNDYLRTKWDATAGGPGAAPIKIGVLYPDLPPWQRAVRQQLLPGLARRGFPVDPDNVVQWHFAQDTSQVSDSVATYQSAVLKFRSNGVTHVFLTENNGPLFTQFAERQNYRPRYAVTSANQIQGWYASGAVPAAQLSGATGIGWYPTYDLPSPKGYEPRGRARCLQLMQDGGAEVSSDNNAILAALSTCDEFLLLQRALAVQGASPVFSRHAVRQGVEAIGTTFVFAGIPSGSYRPGKRYPIDHAWLWAWDAKCSCMRYTSPSFPLRGV